MRRALGTLRLIAGAMIATTAAVAVGLTLSAPERNPDQTPWIVYAALGWAVVTLVLRFGILARVEQQGLERITDKTFRPTPQSGQQALVDEFGDEGRLFLVFQTRTVVALAVLESAAFVCAIAGRVQGGWLGGMAALMLCAAMLADWPTAARWEAWRAGAAVGHNAAQE